MSRKKTPDVNSSRIVGIDEWLSTPPSVIEISSDSIGDIEECTQSFVTTGDFVDAMRAYCMSMELGINPPQEVIDHIGKAFFKYLFETSGAPITNQPPTISLDSLLGLKGKRGGTHPLKKKAISARNKTILERVDGLIFTGMSAKDAKKAVFDFIESSGIFDDCSGFDLNLREESFYDICNKTKRAKMTQRKAYQMGLGEAPGKYSDDDIKKFRDSLLQIRMR